MNILHINKTSKDSIIESLNLIAENLILNSLIVINESLFSMIDIELYYWHKMHPDDYSRGIKHLRPCGEFEMHRYGIDLSLGNQDNIDFGGILIRGLYDINKKQVVKKSEVVKTLFNQFIQGENRFKLINEKSPWNDIFKSKRLNLGKPDSDNKKKFVNAKYKYLAKDRSIFIKYDDKETIFRDSNLDEMGIKNTLGYNLAI